MGVDRATDPRGQAWWSAAHDEHARCCRGDPLYRLELWESINQLLVMAARQIEGREAQPTAGVIDSQSVKTTESGGISGYDAGKSAPRRRVSPVEEGFIQRVVD
jgi:hypothetical protein